jgi:hypothetical protein
VTRKEHDDKPIQIRIKLPLPADVVATIMKMFGLTYPRTQIADDGHAHAYERELVLQIDPRDRHKDAKAMKKYQKIRDNADGWVGWLTEIGPNGIGLGPHEMLAKAWVSLAKESFNTLHAPNYIESKVYDSEDKTEYVFWVAKARDRTPHELRQAAEARAEKAEARVAELEAQLAAVNDA